MTDNSSSAEPANEADWERAAPAHDLYSYATAGISEHQGAVPLWLWMVVVALLVWGLYYLITYWTAPLH